MRVAAAMAHILLRELAHRAHRGKRVSEWIGGSVEPALSAQVLLRQYRFYSGSSISSQAARWSGLPTDPDIGRAGMGVSLCNSSVMGRGIPALPFSHRRQARKSSDSTCRSMSLSNGSPKSNGISAADRRFPDAVSRKYPGSGDASPLKDLPAEVQIQRLLHQDRCTRLPRCPQILRIVPAAADRKRDA